MRFLCVRLLSRRLLNDQSQYPLLKPTAVPPRETAHDIGIAAGAAQVTLAHWRKKLPAPRGVLGGGTSPLRLVGSLHVILRSKSEMVTVTQVLLRC